MGVHEHRRAAPAKVDCGILTVSDTRTEENDTSGRCIADLLSEAGHRVGMYRIVKDEPERIREVFSAVPQSLAAVICNGGTGLSARDRTYEAVSALLDKEITGFGELFRMLSYEQIGAAAMLSRATAGVIGSRLVFLLPGSTPAVELAMKRLILPELGHAVSMIRGAK